jgi:hypothetical protein
MNIEDPRIQQYIDNELSDSEKASFESELNSFPEIKEYIEFKKYIIEGIRSEGDEELKEYIRSRVQDESSENQTNLWLYAVASVTLVLVSYFFIIQYFKTGSIKEASKVLVLNEPIFSKQSKIPYKSGLPPVADSTYYNVDSTIAMNENQATDEEIQMGDADMPSMGYSVPSVSYENVSPETSVGQGDIFVHSSTLIPIKIASPESKIGRIESSSSADFEERANDKMTLSKKKMPPAASISPNNRKENADTAVLLDAEITSLVGVKAKIKKTTEKVSLIFVQNKTENTTIDVTVKNDILVLKISNLDSDNPLIYSINDKLYLELGPKSIFTIPQNTAKLINPKPITDKAILKAIQD